MSKRSDEFAKIQAFDQAMRKIVAVPKDAVVDQPRKKRQGRKKPRRKPADS
jgi:hypothetical protein